MPNYTDHIIICWGCGIPMDECPDSWQDWLVQNRWLACPHGDPDCHHPVFTRYWCVRCTQEGKAEAAVKMEEDCPHGSGGRSCADACLCACHYNKSRRTA